MADPASRRLILASTSPYRRALLHRLGVPFEAMRPTADEEALKVGRAGDPRGLAEFLAREKAASLRIAHPDATLIGSDQLVAFRGAILGKPGDRDGAIRQLTDLAGATHELITAVAVVTPSGEWLEHTDVTRLAMRRLETEEIIRYIDADRPFDCAGSYKLESRGIALFERIESDDHSAVTGLPLIALTGMLRKLGFRVP